MNIMRGGGREGGSRREGRAGCGNAERTGRGNGCGGRESEAQGASGVDHSQGKGKGTRPHVLEREPHQRIRPYAIVVVDIRGF
jgi:hypothetical protein